jgi:polyisoprenoid-binding protein YceI
MTALPRTAVTSAALLAAAAATLSARAAVTGGVEHYVLDPAKSTLTFVFVQEGAKNQGRFTRFPVTFDFSADNLAASHLEVTVEMSSFTTGDEERDDSLGGDDLFAIVRYPQAHFSATQFMKTASGFEAVGKLTLRGVTRDFHVPFTFRTATENGVTVGYMSGRASVRRLDFGVGQGDFKATDQVGNDVDVAFALRLTGASAH